MNRKKPLLTFRQTDPIRLECAIDLNRLFESENERSRFDEKWISFLKSEPHNQKIYRLNRNQLTYQSEHFIPFKKDNRPPLLLVFGNPASHSVAAGIFFAFKDNGKESRFWKSILKPAGVLSFSFDENLPAEKLNALRKKQLLELDYETPFRIGLSVFISMPSAPSGPWGGVAGIQKLVGVSALRRLEAEESKRITKCAKAFIGDDPRGKVVTFQKNAWNGLRSNQNPEYKIEMAKDAKLMGCLRDQPKIQIFGVPPTRLAGPARNVLAPVVLGKAC
ncbi:MAG TPA: hypothetical protein ENI07_21995 [Desulfobacterales bacterium]|nr:hypothetical protein [Desulfobacterales bacterium]